MPDKVELFNGAPQSLYSDHFLHTQPVDGPIGFKMEVPPIHPILGAINIMQIGQQHAQYIQQPPYVNAIISLLRDGFHPDSVGGKVELRRMAHRRSITRFPIMSGKACAAPKINGEMQFAAGAKW